MKRVIVSALFSAALVAGSGFAAESGPAFVMRIDDNHSPADWRQVCEIFERQGFRCDLAVVAARLDVAQGKCLKDLAARGHELLDHTPNHSFYSIDYPDAASFERARKLPFAHDADEKTRREAKASLQNAAYLEFRLTHPKNDQLVAKLQIGRAHV